MKETTMTSSLWLLVKERVDSSGDRKLAGSCGGTSARLWRRMSGVLDCIKRGADVKVLGLKKTSQPAAFVCEAHGQHLSQGLHQTRIRLCDTDGDMDIRGITPAPASVWDRS